MQSQTDLMLTYLFSFIRYVTLFLLNVSIPGAGFIILEKYHLACITQAALALTVITVCLSRLIFTPIGIYTFATVVILTYAINTTLLFTNATRTPQKWTIKNTSLTALFIFTCMAGLSSGFLYKHHWLGIHINFIPSQSMQPALIPGDFILIDTWHYREHSANIDDILTFTLPNRDGFLVKRVQAWPNKLKHKKNAYYALGDNGAFSHDSRDFGGIQHSWLKGKVKIILCSVDRNLNLRHTRILQPVK